MARQLGCETVHSPLPSLRFWFNTEIERRSAVDVLPPTTPEQHWARLKYFLENLCPVAEKYGMKLCAHPYDPPIEYLDGTIIPDHTPRLDAADWWETGMAFALGYMRGIMP